MHFTPSPSISMFVTIPSPSISMFKTLCFAFAFASGPPHFIATTGIVTRLAAVPALGTAPVVLAFLSSSFAGSVVPRFPFILVPLLVSWSHESQSLAFFPLTFLCSTRQHPSDHLSSLSCSRSFGSTASCCCRPTVCRTTPGSPRPRWRT